MLIAARVRAACHDVTECAGSTQPAAAVISARQTTTLNPRTVPLRMLRSLRRKLEAAHRRRVHSGNGTARAHHTASTEKSADVRRLAHRSDSVVRSAKQRTLTRDDDQIYGARYPEQDLEATQIRVLILCVKQDIKFGHWLARHKRRRDGSRLLIIKYTFLEHVPRLVRTAAASAACRRRHLQSTLRRRHPNADSRRGRCARCDRRHRRKSSEDRRAVPARRRNAARRAGPFGRR